MSPVNYKLPAHEVLLDPPPAPVEGVEAEQIKSLESRLVNGATSIRVDRNGRQLVNGDVNLFGRK
ncbi:hypothetical protein GCM10009792_18480 [Microcella alkalica]